jgi:hypothetical protein
LKTFGRTSEEKVATSRIKNEVPEVPQLMYFPKLSSSVRSLSRREERWVSWRGKRNFVEFLT